jgi:hypothetical protein
MASKADSKSTKSRSILAKSSVTAGVKSAGWMEANLGRASCCRNGFSTRVDMASDACLRVVDLDKKEEKALAQDDVDAINRKAVVAVALTFIVR